MRQDFKIKRERKEMANKGKKLTVDKVKKDFTPKREKKTITVTNEEGTEITYWIEVDSRFVESKKADLASEMVANLIYEDENEEYKFTVEEKETNFGAYIIALCLKHFTSLDDIGETYAEVMSSVFDFVDAGLWTDIVKTMDEDQVASVFKYISDFIEKNNENISIALEQAKQEIENDEVLAQFDFLRNEVDEDETKSE